MRKDTSFARDDIRSTDPKFQPPFFERYLRAVDRLDNLARERFGKRVLHLALRWLLDQPGMGVALWGARRPDQIDAVGEVFGWHLDPATMQDIDGILRDDVRDGPGPEFMAPPKAAA
jgi:aryl-alcohol dehydrogenase-like predicted oxidoreductase